MKVWILIYNFPYEVRSIVGVFTSLELAEKAREERGKTVNWYGDLSIAEHKVQA